MASISGGGEKRGNESSRFFDEKLPPSPINTAYAVKSSAPREPDARSQGGRGSQLLRDTDKGRKSSGGQGFPVNKIRGQVPNELDHIPKRRPLIPIGSLGPNPRGVRLVHHPINGFSQKTPDITSVGPMIDTSTQFL